MPRRWSTRSRRRRRAGAAMLFTPEMSGLLDRDRARAAASIVRGGRRSACSRRCARRRRRHGHLGASRLAGGAARATAARQSRLRDRRRRRDPRALRQDPSVRRRSADRRELARIGGLCAGRARGGGRHAARAAGPVDLLRPALPRPVPRAERRRRDGAGGPGRVHPADRRGALARAAARARDRGGRASSSPRRRPAMHEDGRATYGHSLVVDPWGEVLLDMGEARGARLCRDRSGAARPTSARAIPALEHRRAIPPVETCA